MSVKIEILDYKYSSDNNLTDVNQASSGLSSGWAAVATTNASWDGSGSGVTFLNNISSQSLVIGVTYNLSFRIYNYTGTGDMGFSTSSGVPSTARFSSNTSGVQNFTFVATDTSFPDLYGRSTNTGNISYISITEANVIDWDNSIVGELDITDHSDFPLALTFQISDFKDLTSTSGDYSKTFKIPATKNNNNLLKHLYIPNINVDNKVTEKKSCRILFNNLYSLVGLIQVDGVGGYGETPSYYSCVFFGSNLSWADKIQDAYMNTIGWGDDGENIAYNKDSIVATWQHEDCNNASNSPIVYPVTSYGDYNELGTVRTIQLLDTASTQPIINGSTGYYGFNDDGDSYGTPDPVADWRPSVFVKTTLDKIFNYIGYTINSAFMNTDMFKKLVWLLPNFKYNDPDQRVLDYSVRSNFVNGVSMTAAGTGFTPITENGVQVFNEGSLSESDGDYFWNEAGTETLDIQASNITVTLNDSFVDMANNYVTIEEYGNYIISLNGLQSKLARAYKGSTSDRNIASIDTRVIIEVQTVGQNSWNIINSTGTNELIVNQVVDFNSDASTDYKDIEAVEINRYLNKGDKIRLKLGIRLFAGDTTQPFAVWVFYQSKSNSNFDIELNPLYVEYGQTYNLEDVISSDYKQIDFIKGIAHAFNLQMTTDESAKIVNIEPFDTFYKPYGDAIDWTYKLDRSSEISDKWLESDLKRNLVFKYKSDDADAKVKFRGVNYFHDIQDEFPYREILPDTFKKGDSTFENPFFAGTYNSKDQDGVGGSTSFVDTAFSACLWTENTYPTNTNRPTKGYDFLPRLLYWNKYSPDGATVGLNKLAQVQTWSNTNKFIVAKSAIPVVNLILSNIYPQATMVNRDSNSSPVLSYGNVWVSDYDDATGVYAAQQAGKGLYDTYYRNMMEGLKRSPRLRTVYVALQITDIINLDFTKLIYIDGVYWRINKIVDYQPNKNESTKVELIEWFQIGVFAATAPSFGISTSGVGDGWGKYDESNFNIGL